MSQNSGLVREFFERVYMLEKKYDTAKDRINRLRELGETERADRLEMDLHDGIGAELVRVYSVLMDYAIEEVYDDFVIDKKYW